MRIIIGLAVLWICVDLPPMPENAFVQTAMAQAGSTGGTIGETGKSASGGESAREPRVARRHTSSS